MDGYNKIQQEFANSVIQFMRYKNDTCPLSTSYNDFTLCFLKPTTRDYEWILSKMINLSKNLPSNKQQTYLDLVIKFIKYITFKYNSNYRLTYDIDDIVICDIIKPSGRECVALIYEIIYLLK